MFASRLLHRASRLHEGLKAGCFFANRAHPYWLKKKKKKSKSYAGFSQSCLDNLDSWTRFTDPSVWLLQLRRGKPNSRTLARLFWQVRKFVSGSGASLSAGAPAPPAHGGACYTCLKVWALSTCTCRMYSAALNAGSTVFWHDTNEWVGSVHCALMVESGARVVTVLSLKTRVQETSKWRSMWESCQKMH